MSKISSCFLIDTTKSNALIGYDIKSEVKKLKTIYITQGIYLCFIDEILLTKNIEDQFCEALYDNRIIALRYRDIVNLII